MQNLISNTFTITASKDAVSFDHQDNYSLIEASGNMPAANDPRWRYIPVGGEALKPTSAAPYLWHKVITYLTDGSHLEPVISFGGSMGQNGIDFDLVPSASSILKSEAGEYTPASVTCGMIRRNADGSAQSLTTIPAGYSIWVFRDTQLAGYSLGQEIPTTGTSVISFVLRYNGVDVERHDIRVIAEGSQGIDGRGIQSQDYRFKATSNDSMPAIPSNDTKWNTWLSLQDANYSESTPYLWKCIRTVYINGDGTTDTNYHVEGPTVWGRSGESPFIVDLDNEMTSIPVSSEAGKVESELTISFGWKGFYGQRDVTSDCSITANPNNSWPSGFSCDVSNKTTPQITVAANTVPSSVTDLEFKISHPVYGDRYIKFTVAAIKSGGMGQNAVTYELLPSLTEIAVGRTTDGGYNPNPLNYAITCGYVKYDGVTVAGSSADLSDAVDGYSIYFRMRQRSNGTWSQYYKYASYKNTYLVSGKFNVLTYNKLEFILCKNTSGTIANESGVTSLVDRESIPVVADGVNGTSPYMVDIDNEMGAVECDAAGNVVAATTFVLKLSAWYGITDVTAALTFDDIVTGNDAVTLENTIATNHELTITIPAGTALANVTEIQIPVKHSVYEPLGRTLTFTIASIRPGSQGEKAVLRELLPSLTQIVFSRVTGTNALTPINRTLTVSIRRTEGGVSTIQTISEANVVVRWSTSSMPASKTVGNDISTNACTIPSTTSASYVYLAAFDKTAGTLLDKETIPIIKDGEKGAAGTNGRGIQSIDYRFKATTTDSMPTAPTNDTQWSEGWNTLQECGYSESTPYLWKCLRTTYVNGDSSLDVEYDVEGPTVWGRSGESPFVVDLDNEMTSIPVSSGEGKVESALTISFGWKGFYGQTDVTSDCTITANPNDNWPTGFTCDTSNAATPQITIGANTVPANVTGLEFKISHSTYGDRYVKFTIAAVKSGGVGQNAVTYELLPSLTEIAVGRTASGGYTPNPLNYAITCGYVKYEGLTVASSSTNLTGTIDGYRIYFRLRQRSNGTWSQYFQYSSMKAAHLDANKFNVLSYNKLEFILCKNATPNIASESAIVGLVDRESIPVVADGVNGTSPYMVDLDNEMGAVACNADGSVVADTTFTLRCTAWFGTTDITAALTFGDIVNGNDGITVENTIATDKKLTLTIPAGTILDDVTEVQIPVIHSVYEPVGRTLVFTIASVRPGGPGQKAVLRELLPSLTQIMFSRVAGSNALTPTNRTLTVSIRRTEGGETTVQTISAANVVVRWAKNAMPASATAGNNLSTTACTIQSSETASYIGLAAFDLTSGTLLDKETIPIIKDGEKGASGDDGNGVSAVTLARMFTMGFEAPSETDSGWIEESANNYPTESGLSEANRYLWQRKKTTYTLSSDITYEVSLVSQLQSGIKANLLENTAFLDDNEMDGWQTHVGSVVKSSDIGLAQNGWKHDIDPTEASVDFLVQKIWERTGERKIQPNRWYTLSFYAAQDSALHLFAGNAYNTGGTSEISGAISQFYLSAGQSAKVYVVGRITNASLTYMRITVSTADGSTVVQSQYADIRSTSATTAVINITNNQSTGRIFTVCPRMYNSNGSPVTSSASTYRGYCTEISVERGQTINTYINCDNWSSDSVQHGTGAVMYVDGVKVTGSTTLSDGTVVMFNESCIIGWKLSSTPTRHTITFKTASYPSAVNSVHVRFRQTSRSHNGWISMPKLEENTIATEWIENSADRYAADFQHVYVGNWKPSVLNNLSSYYMFALGVRHVVRAKKSATESDMTYFRMKKRTSNQGYCSTVQPYADSENWEVAAYLKFIAADLLLAEEVMTDKLTVSKIRSKDDTFVVDENGNVTANGGDFRNIRVSAGSSDGARVEILPKTTSDGGGKMAIYDSSNNVVAQYSGEVINDPTKLYGSSQDNVSVQISNKGLNVANYGCTEFIWKTTTMNDYFQLSRQMVLSISATSVYVQVTPAEDFVMPQSDCAWKIDLYLNGQILYSYMDIAVRGEQNAFTINVPTLSGIGKSGQNVLTFELGLCDKDFSDKSGTYGEASASWNAFVISGSVNKQMSYHFANGLAIGKSSTHYFITYGISSGMVHEMRSGSYGLRVHPTNGIQKWQGNQWVSANL